MKKQLKPPESLCRVGGARIPADRITRVKD